MPCPHGCGDPSSCSQCRGWVPRRVAMNPDTRELTIDGVPAGRPVAMTPGIGQSTYGKRGGKQRGRSKRLTAEMDKVDPADVDEE